MLYHVSLGVNDVGKAAEFYDAVLGAMGYKRTAQYLPFAVAYGEGVSEFWIQRPHDGRSAMPGNGVHVAFTGRSRDAVIRFHAAALAAGGTEEGSPGPRPDYGADYYGAFVRDPFGNKIEAVARPQSAKMPARRPSRTSGAIKTARSAAKTKAHARGATAKSRRRKEKRR